MLSCVKSQETETAERNEANLLCPTQIKNLMAAEEILAKVNKALKKFCDKLEERTDGLENLTVDEYFVNLECFVGIRAAKRHSALARLGSLGCAYLEHANLEDLVNSEYVVNLVYSVNLEYFELGAFREFGVRLS